MNKQEVKRMISLVDEKYLDEISDMDSSQFAPKRKPWAVIAVAVCLCIPFGYALATMPDFSPAPQNPDTASQITASSWCESRNIWLTDAFHDSSLFCYHSVPTSLLDTSGFQLRCMPQYQIWHYPQSSEISHELLTWTYENENGQYLSCSLRPADDVPQNIPQTQNFLWENLHELGLPDGDVMYYHFYGQYQNCIIEIEAKCYPNIMKYYSYIIQPLVISPNDESFNIEPDSVYKQSVETTLLTLAQANLKVDFCSGFVIGADTLDDMHLSGHAKYSYVYGDNGEERFFRYKLLQIKYADDEGHSLTVEYYPIKQDHNYMPVFPELSAPDFQFDIINDEPFCTISGNNTKSYAFWTEFPHVGCVMAVYGNCTPEQMQAFTDCY